MGSLKSQPFNVMFECTPMFLVTCNTRILLYLRRMAVNLKVIFPVLCLEQFHEFPQNPRFYRSHRKNRQGHFGVESHARSVSRVPGCFV